MDKGQLPRGPNYTHLKHLTKTLNLHTVCEEAKCPNIGECWGAGTLTFMILGDTCTRSCGFCHVKTGRGGELDFEEPMRVAEAVRALTRNNARITHIVITSVNRDDRNYESACIFAETIRRVRDENPEVKIEVLIPDFKGDPRALREVIDARPDVLNHNIETVPRLYGKVRPGHSYEGSLQVLHEAKKLRPEILTKSGFMLGVGETADEVIATLKDLRERGVDIVTIGQYLQPSSRQLPVERYVTPGEFEEFKSKAEKLGFRHVESGPLVRSSYHAWSHVN